MTNNSRVKTTGVDSKMLLLMSKCKASVHLDYNRHKSYYETAKQYLLDQQYMNDGDPVADSDVINQMIETDTVICLQFYPDTPIGSYRIYHYDYNLALDEALSTFI